MDNHEVETAMRRNLKNQRGFTIIEAMIGLFIVATVFAFSFQNLASIRKSTQAINTTGPHVFFETFAVSRLKLYFAKLMQWNTHVCPGGLTDDCVCKSANFFAYAPSTTALDDGRANARLANLTLGTDLRMALSTFTAAEISPNAGTTNSLIALAQARRANPAALPWGALIPIQAVAEWDAANPAARRFCSTIRTGSTNTTAKNAQGTVNEMCEMFAKCTQEAGRAPFNTQINAGRNDISAQNEVLMCFVFAGNLFTRPDVNNNRSTSLLAIDFPSVVGLAVGKATFVDNTNGQPLSCLQAASEMNRSLKIELSLYSAMQSDQQDVTKHMAQKSVREITGEKIGIAVPNCSAPGRGGFSAVGNQYVCIEDPTWLYHCNRNCIVR